MENIEDIIVEEHTEGKYDFSSFILSKTEEKRKMKDCQPCFQLKEESASWNIKVCTCYVWITGGLVTTKIYAKTKMKVNEMIMEE